MRRWLPACCNGTARERWFTFAAESHVDRSILGPEAFLRTNIDGTFTLLQAARAYYEGLASADREKVPISACFDR